MIDPANRNLSIVRQCRLLKVSRSGWYYKPKEESPFNLSLMRMIDEQFLATPYYGSRQMMRQLRRSGYRVSRKRVRRLMRLMGLQAIYQAPKTSLPHPEHKVYPYLLKDITINRPNQVWCSDITYIPIKRGFLYLVAIMDWYSRKVLSWRISNTLDVEFCVEALKEAIFLHGIPDIFNTDQGSQYTSLSFTNTLKDHGIKISMDGKGRWMDNVFIERLWRSLKYECVYLNNFENGWQAKVLIGNWISHYNRERPHSTFDGQTPHEVYVKMKNLNGAPHSETRLAA
jgi:putative transposase